MGVLGSFADTDAYQYWLPDSTWHRFMSSISPAEPTRDEEGGQIPRQPTATASVPYFITARPQAEQEQRRQDGSGALHRALSPPPSFLPYRPQFRPSDAAARLVKCIRDLSSGTMTDDYSGDLRLSLQTYSDIVDQLNSVLVDITRMPRSIGYRTSIPAYSPVSPAYSPRSPVFEPVRDLQIDIAPLKPSPAARLPAELLFSIFLLARDMHLASPTESTSPNDRFQLPKSTRSYAFSHDAKGAFYFSLSLANVCKSWRAPAIAAALQSPVLPSGPALRDLETLISSSPFRDAYASQIAELKVLVLTGLDASASDVYDSERSPNAPIENGKQVDAMSVCGSLLSMLPNLQKLEIALFPARAKVDLSRRNYMRRNTPDYLSPALLAALTGLNQFRSLTFSCGIDFEDLEAILLNLPLLRDFAAQAISDISETGAISSSSAYPASRLASFCVGRDRSNSGSDVQPAQLAWLLGPPSVGTVLRQFGSDFADLLQMNGSLLEVLVRIDSAETGRTSPHSAQPFSNFDATFASLSALRNLAVDWCYTGPAFISTISSLENLKQLEMTGAPHDTPAVIFLAALQHAFPALKRLVLNGDVTGSSTGRWGRRAPPRGRTDWTGSTIRKLQAICDERDIEYSLKEREVFY
ncbi:hypothetical protein AAT19DRAFT_11609 [Rhodotorula toruloides]|uniref:Uncharacterized protein n=1 Tax=Rhodotorula toruloides TaxID=5286 RepID=A0A2S9ZW22_RHOTO|nr:hypothetical protein AAT19DRAFT_11609 [Rhodotorula toruloides]